MNIQLMSNSASGGREDYTTNSTLCFTRAAKNWRLGDPCRIRIVEIALESLMVDFSPLS